MKFIWLVLALVGNSALAILPLPYPTEPMRVDLPSALELTWDPKQIAGYQELFQESQKREMELPTFEEQPSADGYKPGETFMVPPELRKRVEFWKRIYSEFTSSQAVLHDSDYPEIIYSVVDLSPILNQSQLTYRKQRRLIEKLIKTEKKKIEGELRFLQANQADPTKIPLNLFPIFKQFDEIKEPNRFVDAIDRVRTQVGQRDRIVEGFMYGGRYFPEMMRVFEKKHIPGELTRLPLVESAFNLGARSKVGASGVWQFMLSTGKRFLRIDRAIDERNDPIASAWAAADLLAENYQALGTWPLAITAYNHGREGMERAVRTVASKDLGDIIRNYKARTFGFASANFFSEFLAILELERDYRKSFGKLMVDAPIQYEEFNVSDNVRLEELAGACRLSESAIASLNPALTDWVLSGEGFVPRGYTLRVPVGKGPECRSGYRNVAKIGNWVFKRAKLTARLSSHGYRRRTAWK